MQANERKSYSKCWFVHSVFGQAWPDLKRNDPSPLLSCCPSLQGLQTFRFEIRFLKINIEQLDKQKEVSQGRFAHAYIELLKKNPEFFQFMCVSSINLVLFLNMKNLILLGCGYLQFLPKHLWKTSLMDQPLVLSYTCWCKGSIKMSARQEKILFLYPRCLQLNPPHSVFPVSLFCMRSGIMVTRHSSPIWLFQNRA